MITNNSITLYHKIKGRKESYERYNYYEVWAYGGHGASLNEGLADMNDLKVRIPYGKNIVDINNIKVGDIIVLGTLTTDITAESDLEDYYKIKTVYDNKFGDTPHIRIGAK